MWTRTMSMDEKYAPRAATTATAVLPLLQVCAVAQPRKASQPTTSSRSKHVTFIPVPLQKPVRVVQVSPHRRMPPASTEMPTLIARTHVTLLTRATRHHSHAKHIIRRLGSLRTSHGGTAPQIRGRPAQIQSRTWGVGGKAPGRSLDNRVLDVEPQRSIRRNASKPLSPR